MNATNKSTPAKHAKKPKSVTLLSTASPAVIASFKADGFTVRLIDATPGPTAKKHCGPVAKQSQVQALPKAATPTKPVSLSARGACPVVASGSVAPVPNIAGASATLPKKSSRWPFWDIITKVEIVRRREARRLNPPPPTPPRDPQAIAAEKAAKRARLFLPNGKRAEQHWRPWLESAAKAEKMTLDEAAEHFGGLEALSAPKGYRHRMALSEFANAMATQSK